MTAGDVRQGRQIEWTGLHLDRERDRMTARQKVDTEELTGRSSKETEKKSDVQTWRLSIMAVIFSSYL